MNPVASPRFGMYHTIGTVTGGHSNFLKQKELGALHMEMILSNHVPYDSPEAITPKKYPLANPNKLQEMKTEAAKHHPFAQSIQDTFKRIDPDYRKDAFALAVSDKGNLTGIATGKDARFLESVLDEQSNRYANYVKDLTQAPGRTLDVTMTEDADGQRVVKNVNIR